MQISWSLLCCTILYVAYTVDIQVITLLHNIVGSVLCIYLGHYFAVQYCRQSSMQISQSLLCCTILQAAYNVDMLVVTLLHNIVDSVLCRYLGRYFAAQYCRQRTMQISWSLLCCTIMQAVYYGLGHYFAAQYCRHVQCRYVGRTILCTMISWSLLCCTILQTAYYVDILVITLLHNNVGSVLCRYLGYYFATQYCRQRSMQISWSLLCWTILQAVYYVDRYLGHYFAAQYCRQCTMQISWSFLCCTTLQAAYYVDILVITFLHDIVGSVLCRYLSH